MAKTTPAVIYYETPVKGSTKTKTNKIKFHAVIAEGHEASSQITKYPSQKGFMISNHAIRKNRVVRLGGIFTNTLLLNTDQVTYSKTSNNSKEMFEVLESLVNSRKVCKVITNLGVYNPVVFNSFSTEQKAGMVDSMSFTISGEELQIASSVINSAPKELTFFDMSDKDREAAKEKFFKAGLHFNSKEIVKVTHAELGKDWSMRSWDYSGSVTTTTFICKGYDPDSDYYSYRLEKTVEQVYQSIGSKLTVPLPPTDSSLLGGIIGVTNCILDKTEDLLIGIVEDKIDTAVGQLKNAAYGFLQEITTIGGSGVLQTIMGFTADCVTAEVADALGYPDVDSVGDARQEATKALDRSINSVRAKGKELVAEGKSGIQKYTTKAVTLIQTSNPVRGPLSTNGAI